MKPGLAALPVVLCGLLLCPLAADAAGKDSAPAGRKAPAAAAGKAPAAAEPGGFAEKGAASAEKRSLAFNKQNVFMYFRQVAEAKNKLPEDMPYEELRDRQCHLYASVLKQSGYDFETTILNAVEHAEKGGNKLDDPRFTFLAGVFQEHPDLFLRLRLISKPTRDAVVRFFGG
ncbi:hypothetical protein [Solidesulfovibrio aerotolerans]|uniref:hypothetical protein n=1 Tax=Solidesulfovibrio aerotolerans TaxID=295255 RepID=UPI0031B586E0